MRFSAIPEITEISVFGKGLGTGQFKAHHIGEDIIHPAQIFGQFKTTLVTAEVADAAVVIVIAEYKILSVTIGLKLKRIVATTDYMLADRFGRIELMSRHRSHYLWIFNPPVPT